MTLSEFSFNVRRFAPFGIVGLVLFILFYLIISNVIVALLNKPQVVTYEPPFGILEPLQFSYAIDYPPSFALTLENIEGRPVTSTSSANVYYVPTRRTRFGYQQTIAFMARAVGIDTESVQYTVDGVNARYFDGLRRLDVDITNYNFEFETDFKSVPEIFLNSSIPSENKIREDAKAFMRQMNKYDELLARGKENVIYLKYDTATQDFTVVKDPAEANVVEVDFFPPNLDGLPVVMPKYFNSSNYVTMVYGEDGQLVIKAQAKYYARDPGTYGLYPIRPGDEAYKELLNRRGTIVSPSQGSTNITIRQMFVAYYQSDLYHEYLLPVYVFLGDDGFAAYVSAIDTAYIKSASESAIITPPQDTSEPFGEATQITSPPTQAPSQPPVQTPPDSDISTPTPIPVGAFDQP